MSDAAARERKIRQSWAEPGGRHDQVVRVLKLGLPAVGAVLLLILAIAPFDRQGDVSFILDKNQVDEAPERMRVEKARYNGLDNKDQPFLIVADRAVQQTSDQPIVSIRGMSGRLDLANGPLAVNADQGQYNLDLQRIFVNGPISVAGPDGYRLNTSDVSVDLKTRQLASAGPVEGGMRLGQFSAGQLRADLGERTVSLTGGARLKIVQGAVR